MDKLRVLKEGGKDTKIFGAVGEIGDVHQFCDFVERNIYLYNLVRPIAAPSPPMPRAQCLALNGIACAQKNGFGLSTHATASFVRRELATALRKGPYSVNMLIAGCDSPGEGEVAAGADASSAEPALYWMDYLGACRKVPFGAHGYCGYFIMSTFDRYYREGLNLDEALEICRKCIAEIKFRFMVDVGDFIAKVVTKDGVREVSLSGGGGDAMDTAP